MLMWKNTLHGIDDQPAPLLVLDSKSSLASEQVFVLHRPATSKYLVRSLFNAVKI
jgi:hypothetical protein